MKRNNKLYIISICIVIILAISIGVLNETRGYNNKNTNDQYKIDFFETGCKVHAIKEYNNEVYLMTESGIGAWRNNKIDYLVKKNIESYNAFDIDEKQIIFTDNKNKALYKVNRSTNYIQKIEEGIIEDYNIMNIHKVCLKNGSAWILGNTSDFEKDILLKVNLANEEVTKVLEKKIYSMEYVSEECILTVCWDEQGFNINKYNFQTGEEEKILNFKDDIWDITYNHKNKEIYFCSYAGLFRYKEGEKNYTTIINNPYSEKDKRIYGFSSLKSKIVLSERGLGTLEKDEDVKKKLVMITDENVGNSDFSGVIKNSILEIKKTNPAVDLEQVCLQNYTENIRKKLLARDTEFDIFTLDINEISNIDSKILRPLNEYNQVNNVYDEMFEGIKLVNENQTKNIVSIPKNISTPTWAINEKLKEQLEFEISKSKNWTWDEFLEQAKDHRKDLNEDGKPDIWLTSWTGLDIIDYVYQTNRVSKELDESSLKKLLQAIKTAQDEGVLMNNKQKQIATRDETILVDTMLTGYKVEGCGKVELLLPCISKNNPIYVAIGSVYCVNPYSENFNIGVELLSESVKPQNSEQLALRFLYKNKELYNRDYEYVEPLDLAEVNFDRYKYAFDHLAIANECLHSVGLIELVEDYLNGKIEVDIVIQKLLEDK